MDIAWVCLIGFGCWVLGIWEGKNWEKLTSEED